MYAAESNAPEGSGAQAPDLRGGRVYGHGSRRCVRPRMRGGAKRQPVAAQAPEPPAILPLRRAGVVGILCAGGFPARGSPGGAYNAELAAAKGRSPEGGAPRGPRDGRKNFLKKVLDTAERAR